jgi:hypothetical protein
MQRELKGFVEVGMMMMILMKMMMIVVVKEVEMMMLNTLLSWNLLLLSISFPRNPAI